jgi:hypothetical protein
VKHKVEPTKGALVVNLGNLMERCKYIKLLCSTLVMAADRTHDILKPICANKRHNRVQR